MAISFLIFFSNLSTFSKPLRICASIREFTLRSLPTLHQIPNSMQTSTFTNKPLRQRRFLSFLFPLFAIFIGLGNVQAQPAGTSTATIRNVLVTAGTSAASVNTSTYNAIPTSGGTGIGGGIFASTNFGSLDVSSGRLLLQGGTVTITEAPGETFQRAYIEFGVGTGTINGVNGATVTSANPSLTSVIELTQTNYDMATGVRTFALSNANRDILALATNTNNGAGQSYRFDVTVNALGQRDDGSGGFEDITIAGGNGNRRRSVFTATGTPSTATLSPNNVQVATDGNASDSYFFPNTGINPQFPNFNFVSSTNAGGVSGAFDVNNGQLRLTNTTVNTTETGTNSITSVVLYYRTRSSTSGGGAYQPITLAQSGPAVNGVRTFVIDPASTNNTNAQPNLVATPAVTAPGTYNVDIYYQANGINTTTGNTFTILYPPSGYFTATFTVAGTPIATTIWTGAVNDNWFDAANWSNGVPTATTNALIRDLGAGNSVPYPNINSDIVVRTAGGTLLYDNSNTGPAQTLNLIMGGTSQASRSITRLVTGQLKVYGTFDNTYDSFIQRENTIMEFAGGNQTITGGTFVRVDISGGGTKTLNGIMNVSESLNFLTPNVSEFNTVRANPYTMLSANAGVLSTDIKFPNTQVVVLADRAIINGNNGAQINGETDLAYLRGFARTSRQSVATGETRTYGNLGMTLTFFNNSPGNVEVTRNTVEAYSPVSGRYGIRRIFGVRPSDQQTNTGGLNATMVFRYRDSETMNLNGQNTFTPGSSSIPESQLTIFVSTNSGNTFQLVGRDGPVNTTANTVTRSNVRTFATFTLGDEFNPLPVRLTAFDAKRLGSSALVTWQTASEQNSKGYEVQVSTNGTEYRTLAFVPSASPNSTSLTSYSYEDKEANKAGVRYYRLHQIDIDGKDAFFNPVAVSFDGKAITSGLTVYPNPFNSNDELHVAMQASGAGKGSLLITDMTGRTVRQQAVDVNNGLTDLAITGMGELKAGIYLVKFTLPSGEVKNMKVMKK